MSSAKTFVGSRAASLREADKLQPYTKVTVTDGTSSYSAGTATGRELVVEVPVLPTTAGQTLANNLLASVQGYRYQPYEADSALIDPAAELGDGITVGGVYGGIHARTATFSRLFRANVSAPAEEEIDSEYPYLSAQERDAVRQKKQTAKNTADIASNTSAISGVSAQVSSLSAQIANIDTLYARKATVNNLAADVANVEKLVADKVSASYLESYYLTASEIKADYCEVNGATINNIKSNIANIDTLFTNAGYAGTITARGVYTPSLHVDRYTFSPQTITYKNGSGTSTTKIMLVGT